jgi:F0F1-type ATP synthase membrane subunit c/vacuolar-type H+-ATPase subunit K
MAAAELQIPDSPVSIYPTGERSCHTAGEPLPLAGFLSLEPFGPPPSRTLVRLVTLALLVAAGVSSSLLSNIGVPYTTPTGNFLFKLHPATWLIGLALALALMERGNPLRELGRSLAHQPATSAYVGSVLMMIAWSVARFGMSGAAFFIDTLLVPGLLALLLARLDLATQRRLFTVVCLVLVGNALLGIGEQLLKKQLIPVNAGGVLLTDDLFRATALFGHPLSNAMVTGFGLFVLYRLHDRVARFFCCLIAVAALFSFGGRTALSVSVVLLLGLAVVDLVRHARDGGLSYREITGGTALIILALGMIVAAVASGSIGERIMGSLAWDSSAQVREKSILVLYLIGWPQFLFGMSPGEIAKIMLQAGINPPYEAIENFWVLLLLQTGAPLLALFTACLLAFLVRLAILGGAAIGLGFVMFVIAASTSNSLASKTEVFVIVVAMAQLAAAYRCTRLVQEAHHRALAGGARW